MYFCLAVLVREFAAREHARELTHELLGLRHAAAAVLLMRRIEKHLLIRVEVGDIDLEEVREDLVHLLLLRVALPRLIAAVRLARDAAGRRHILLR